MMCKNLHSSNPPTLQSSPFSGIYKGKIVLVTGHTGFKGSWLCLWLKRLGANIIGYALQPPTTPSHYELLTLKSSNLLNIISIEGDIRDSQKLRKTVENYKPEIIFHLAAQPLVRYSYKNPAETFETNVTGTINVFEACRYSESVRAIVNVTSDKCYENREWVQGGYCETDPMGGYDPYSASKGCAEIVTSSYRNSFFNPDAYGKTHHVLLTSARAGNVIGGGDWAEDRLIPDVMKAAGRNECAAIRNPDAVRPWQHVLEPLSGYLMLGQKLLEGRSEFAEGWNFGPGDESIISSEGVVRSIMSKWGRVRYEIQTNKNEPHEAHMLKLDCSKACSKLRWKPNWDLEKTIEVTARWYREFYENNNVLSMDDLGEYVRDAKEKEIEWAAG